jgi:hypothetical protein
MVAHVALPLCKAAYSGGAVVKPRGVLAVPQTVWSALMGHVPVGRCSLGVGGSNYDHELGGTSRHANKICAKGYGSIDGGVVGALLRRWWTWSLIRWGSVASGYR